MFNILMFLFPVFQSQQHTGVLESSGSVFSRFRFSNHRSSSGTDVLSSCTVDLSMSTLKVNAEQSDLRFCFRIITPAKTYTLQVIFPPSLSTILLLSLTAIRETDDVIERNQIIDWGSYNSQGLIYSKDMIQSTQAYYTLLLGRKGTNALTPAY